MPIGNRCCHSKVLEKEEWYKLWTRAQDSDKLECWKVLKITYSCALCPEKVVKSDFNKKERFEIGDVDRSNLTEYKHIINSNLFFKVLKG